MCVLCCAVLRLLQHRTYINTYTCIVSNIDCVHGYIGARHVYYTHSCTATCCQASTQLYWNERFFECVCSWSTVQKHTTTHTRAHIRCWTLKLTQTLTYTQIFTYNANNNTLTHTYTGIPTESEEKQVFSVARSNKQQKELSRKSLYSKICVEFGLVFLFVSRSVWCANQRRILKQRKNNNNNKQQQEEKNKRQTGNNVPSLFVKMAAIKWIYPSQ